MPKYKIIHSLLQTPTRDFKQDEIVTPKELTEAGTDLNFLLYHGTIAPLEGTDDVTEALPFDADTSLLDENDALRAHIAELEARLAGGVNTNPPDVAPMAPAPPAPQSSNPPAVKKNEQGAETGLTVHP